MIEHDYRIDTSREDDNELERLETLEEAKQNKIHWPRNDEKWMDRYLSSGIPISQTGGR